jgi:hypothetical protein
MDEHDKGTQYLHLLDKVPDNTICSTRPDAEPDAIKLLESKLAVYIAQSFLKCGFDEIEDIA